MCLRTPSWCRIYQAKWWNGILRMCVCFFLFYFCSEISCHELQTTTECLASRIEKILTKIKAKVSWSMTCSKKRRVPMPIGVCAFVVCKTNVYRRYYDIGRALDTHSITNSITIWFIAFVNALRFSVSHTCVSLQSRANRMSSLTASHTAITKVRTRCKLKFKCVKHSAVTFVFFSLFDMPSTVDVHIIDVLCK